MWSDNSPLRVRTNRSETALQAFDRGVISAEALRRETGFDDGDAPGAEEQTDDGQDGSEEPPSEPGLPVDLTGNVVRLHKAAAPPLVTGSDERAERGRAHRDGAGVSATERAREGESWGVPHSKYGTCRPATGR